MVEAHGTGTRLGDPIEVEAVTESFRSYTDKKNYCALGSVKSNIGHLMAAAGVTGVIKVLLALKHKQLPPSLHLKKANEHINLQNSPFYVNTELKNWDVKDEEVRIAAVSSFGFSGTNAHVVIEEYVPKGSRFPAPATSVKAAPLSGIHGSKNNVGADVPVGDSMVQIGDCRFQGSRGRNQSSELEDIGTYLVVLSAKNEDRLKDYARKLDACLQNQINSRQASIVNLRDLAYTLQVGRKAMKHRIAMQVKTIAGLKQKLGEYIQSKPNIANFWRGESKSRANALAVDEDFQQTIDAWISKGKSHKLAEFWVIGLNYDWNLLYGGTKPRRISLPTYPFARERYWISESQSFSPNLKSKICNPKFSMLHPLVHENTSNFEEQRFSSTFTGEELFLADHVVKGQKILPGVAYLEMARAAIKQAAESLAEHQTEMQLKNIVWVRPLVVNHHAKVVHIGLFPEKNGHVRYQIYTEAENSDEELIIHGQGVTVFGASDKLTRLDLPGLQATINHSHLSPKQCYDAFKRKGIDYGSGYQGLRSIYVGKDQVLAKLSLPSSVLANQDQYVLNPGIMDSALQASAALLMESEQPTTCNLPLSLPFALDVLDFTGKCAASMWAWIRFSDGSAVGNNIRKVDIELCDDRGNISVRLKGFSSRLLQGRLESGHHGGEILSESSEKSLVGLWMLSPVWDVIPLVDKSPLFPAVTARVLIVGGRKEQKKTIHKVYPSAQIWEIDRKDGVEAMVSQLKAVAPVDHIVWIAPDRPIQPAADETIIQEQAQGVLQVFRLVKALLSLGYGDKEIGWTVITTETQAVHKKDSVNPTHASIHGLVGSLAKEYPHWKIRLLDFEAGQDWPIKEMFALPVDVHGNALAYRRKEWFRQALITVRNFPESQPLYRMKGVYVVIGGAGGIGEVWSQYMIERYQAQLIWIGRRKKDATIQAKLDELAKLGPAPTYIQTDATDYKSLKKAYREIKRRHPQIQGVIHSAIVLLDQGLANMDEQRFHAALSAKVDISIRLAQVFKNEALDFVLFFSSMQSFFKAPGQSNYVAGSTFEDAFAWALAQDWPCAVKVMNWGYWGSVGSVKDSSYRERMSQAGIASIESEEGMEALENLLKSPIEQIALVKLLRSQNLVEMTAKGWITAYPETIPSCIGRLRHQIPDLSRQAQALDSERSFQYDSMDSLLLNLLWGSIQSLGFFKRNQSISVGIEAGANILSLYERWFEESRQILRINGFLQNEKGKHKVIAPSLDLRIQWQKWNQAKIEWMQNSNLKARVVLAENCLRALPNILTGKRPATDILFPNSSMELVEGIYKGNVGSNLFNEVLTKTVVNYLEERLSQDPTAKIRILEIGAGTGGTTAGLLTKLRPFEDHIQEYCYTDISKAFLMFAEKEFGCRYPNITYQMFNVEEPIAGQNLPAGKFDLAIATNVLHATRSIRQTLRNTKATLRRHGLLLLNELSSSSLFAHLTFGLLEGWWLYEDSSLRIPGCPGLFPETWNVVLETEGFQSVFFPSSSAHQLGQQIIVAESDGVVRQQHQNSLRVAPTKERTKVKALKKYPPVDKCSATLARGISLELLRKESTAYIKKMIAETLKIPSHKIDPSEPLEKYGIDSILVVQLTNSLREVLKDISSTLFFEVQTIDALVEHLIKTQKDSLVALLDLEEKRRNYKTPSANNVAVELSSDQFHLNSRKRERFLPVPKMEIVESESTSSHVTDVAIIGLSGRYPQARDVAEFWQHLKSGRNCISEVPKDRWNWELYYTNVKSSFVTMCTKWGGFLEDIDKFDPLFFGISPRQAEHMDPQERLFLEVAYASIQDAGYIPATLSESQRIGVFVGVMNAHYPTGSSYWSIANRVSYIFDFQGPSIAIDTACSSSLTAIHLALDSLYNGSSECAVAGGVNLIVDPIHYLKLSAMNMLSADDQCKAFGAGADGFVDGEGGGCVVLKPLTNAMAAGDHIYGILKGSMVNAGGKTNGYTVPNPNAQYQLILEAFRKARVDARTISYVEAHGTGTVLGDPIEVAALTRAFEQDTQAKQFCAIGSVKSNIGHCESAAGIAGITKVLLQMKYGQFAPSLHAKKLNSNIDFGTTPFVVQQELADWKRPVLNIDGETRVYPRTAGVSSFGAGGANAHVVIEEFVDEEDIKGRRQDIGEKGSYLIVLSAKTEDRLKEVAKNLYEYLISPLTARPLPLHEVTYTLQVGREPMEERLAVIVRSTKELVEILKGFLEDHQDGISNLYRGQVRRNKEALAIFEADEDLSNALKAWIAKGKYEKLLDLWVRGLSFDWNKLYGESKPRRIGLPTYPFAKERYWISESQSFSPNLKSKICNPKFSMLHPLVHENTSNFELQRFSSTFTGEEFFLTDHQIKGEKVLPGVAYLEMARASLEQAVGSQAMGKTSVQLKNIVWARPIVVNGNSQTIHVGLFPEENGQIQYEIYTEAKNSEEETVVHSQGIASFGAADKLPSLDLPHLRASMNQRYLNARQCYNAFRAMGFDYGSGHQSLQSAYGGKNQVLAKLSLPLSLLETQDQYVLHPSLMDSPLQASIGLFLESKTDSSSADSLQPTAFPPLPFGLEAIEIAAKCTDSMWALIHYSDGSSARDKVQKFDINLCDDRGRVSVRMKGFSSRVLDGESSFGENLGTLTCQPIWKEKAIPKEANSHEYSQHLVMLCGIDRVSTELIEAQLEKCSCIGLQSKEKTLEKRYEDISVQVFETIREILEKKPKGKILIQILISFQGEEQVFSGLSGLLKTAHLEDPNILGQVIGIDPKKNEDGLDAKVIENSHCPDDALIRYQGNTRQVFTWEEVPASGTATSLPWKDGGVYLITGGMGGLGLIFAQEITSKTKESTVILAGRSCMSEKKRNQINELRSLGARIEYRQVNVCRSIEVKELIQNIRQEFGGLQGILHSAGVIRDNYILKKAVKEFQGVLGPKVSGVINLDEATKTLDLDFIILFSSIAGVVGNTGQADYSTANAFMDAYAEFRNEMVALKKRKGQTLAINWPFWKEGRMNVEEAFEKEMRQNIGMFALETSSGIQALVRGLVLNRSRVMVLEGDLEQLRKAVLECQPRTEAIQTSSIQERSKSIPPIAYDGFQEKVTNYFKKMLASTLKLPVDRIQAGEPLEKYGMDSILAMELTNHLEKILGSLSKTLFFEYQTIQEVSDYFLEFHGEKLRGLFGVGERREIVPETLNEEASLKRKSSRSRFVSISKSSLANRSVTPLDIAIIGLSGRYPQARDLEEYWANLREGKDCISEIPEDRWDWREYYTEDRGQLGAHYSKWGGFIENVDKFDPLFFNILPREATFMDPQERIFLETVWKALEDAGYCRAGLVGAHGEYLSPQVGVYTGVMYGEYQLFGAEASPYGNRISVNSSYASIANRVSYVLNLHGPSMTVDTMCSSSLTAIHLACQDLKHRRTDLAIAGGVNVTIHPNKYLMLSRGQFISDRGHCESFGEGGDGYIPGEGVGVALLKRLKDAEQDGDHIYGVIKGSEVNHGGKTNGYTVPNPTAQKKAITQALKEAGVHPREISYIEAHGTGTKLGDPIEITGLTKAFETHPKGEPFNRTQTRPYCWLGSVKSNIGHCESAAGIAGVTKVLLQMQHRQIVPSLYSQVLNPHIDFEATPFVVNQELRDWNRPTIEGKAAPRIAGISSFGAGGSNAHIIIEEYENQLSVNSDQLSVKNEPALVVLSAKNQDQLKEAVKNLFIYLTVNGELEAVSLRDLAYTLQVGRETMEERLGFIVGSIEELAENLQGFVKGQDDIEDIYQGQVKHNKDTLAIFVADEELQEAIDKWIQRGKYSKLLDLWVKGLAVNWNTLYRESKPRRISLPTYPFSKERYWITELPLTPHPSSGYHGLVHKNVSTFEKQWLCSTVMSDKPKNVSLQSLSEDRILLTKSLGLNQHSISPSSRICPSEQAEVHDKSKAVVHVQPSISAETLQQELTTSFANSMYMKRSDVDVDKKFNDLGLDSVMGVEWIRAINNQYGTSITVTKIYDFPTIRQLAEYLEKKLKRHRDSGLGQIPIEPNPSPSLKELVMPQSHVHPGTGDHHGRLKQEENKNEKEAKQKLDLSSLGDRFGLVLSTVHLLNETRLQQWIVSDPLPDEVTIQVRASAINFPDTMCIKGLYPTMPDYPFVPGFEVSGIVSRIGSQVSDIHVGDEVIALTGKQMGGHASYVNVPMTHIINKPKTISFEEACSLPVVFGTVYYAFEIAKLAPKEHVLIQTATGGCGLLAIQLAHLKECVCYGTSSRQEKLDILKALGIPSCF